MSLLQIIFPPRYLRYLILTRADTPPLWDYQIWSVRVAPQLDRLFGALSCTPSVQSRQTIRNTSRGPQLGHLDWSDSGHKKWCHNSELTKDKCRDWLFVDTELFCPPWRMLATTLAMPDLYVQVKNQGDQEHKRLYRSALHLAANRSFVQAQGSLIEEIIKEIARSVSTVAIYRCETRVGAPNVFETLILKDFVYRGMHLDGLPDTAKMRGKWSRLDVNSL